MESKEEWDVSTKWPEIKAHLETSLQNHRKRLEVIGAKHEDDIQIKARIALLKELLSKHKES